MAHIRRFDLPINMLQRVVESMLFFHPAVWIVSRRIDIERERAADDLAIDVHGEPAQYADALLRMAELSSGLRTSLASPTLAATGHRPSELKHRVVRLVGSDIDPPRHSRWSMTAVVFAAMCLVLHTTFIVIHGNVFLVAETATSPTQEIRNQFAAAIQANNISVAEQLLKREPALANADLRATEHRDNFSYGHPLHRACEQNNERLAELLLKHGSNPDAPGPDPDDRPVHGMPLHFAAADHCNYRLANMLLDHGATPNSYPNCDKATIERMFYQAREAGMSGSIVRRAYAKYLPDRSDLESQTVTDLVGDASEPITLFARMVDLGAQPPFCALVREGFDDLLMEIVDYHQNESGTSHDHSELDVRENIAGAARWYGYPKLDRRLIDHPSFRYSYESALDTIRVAICSHNRDGGYPEYREIIVMQLELLLSHGDLKRAQENPDYNPLHTIATDFTWHDNYGYQADIANPDCYIDLAELLVSWGFDDINDRCPKTGHSPLSDAVRRGHHPGITNYIRWLLDKGADLRESDSDEFNPKVIAAEKGFDEITQLLARYEKG